MIELIILALATYGTAKLIAEYDGPFDSLYRLRNVKYLKALLCVVCSSLYVGVGLSIVWAFGYALWLTPLALVGIVIILEEKL